jgi:hypothetical protein
MFDEARLKVKRAIHHINDLNLLFERFLKGNTHYVFIEHDANGGDDLLKVKAINRLPEDFELVLGDALHNLRSSLDYVISEIEFLHTGARTDYTAFPVRETRDTLKAAINGGLKVKAPEQVLTFILDTVQPYETGDGKAIFSLHAIDIEDKHRLLIAKAELNFVTGITFEDDTGVERAVDTWLVVNDKVAALPLKGNRHSKVNNQGVASYRILFDDALPFSMLPIIETLHNLVKIVTSVIDNIQIVYVASRFKI